MLVYQKVILPLDPKKYPIWLVVSTYPSKKYEFVTVADTQLEYEKLRFIK